MTSSVLTVESAGPLVSIQDGGRAGHVRHGVPQSGPMDRLAFAMANASLGNAADAPGVEVSAGGLELSCSAGAVTVAVCGGGFSVAVDGEPQASWCVVTVRPGDRLSVRAGEWGSWCCLALAGELRAARWLDSASTHTVSGFGGGVLVAGDELVVDAPRVMLERDGEVPVPDPARPRPFARVVLGPQEHRFDPAAVRTFCGSRFRATSAFDRMGLRLDGPVLGLGDALSIPSEAVLRGAVQVAGDGIATVLLADHQTTGGYPKIATVIGADVDGVAQRRPGDEVRFEAITPAEAVRAARSRAGVVGELVRAAAHPERTLTHRLRRRKSRRRRGLADRRRAVSSTWSGAEAETERDEDAGAVEAEATVQRSGRSVVLADRE